MEASFGQIWDGAQKSFLQKVSSCLVGIMPEKFYEGIEKGSIILKKSERFSFCEEGVMVDEEVEPLKTDLVILATGFKGEKKLRDIFESPTFQDYISGDPNATVPLYRFHFLPDIHLPFQ